MHGATRQGQNHLTLALLLLLTLLFNQYAKHKLTTAHAFVEFIAFKDIVLQIMLLFPQMIEL
jgi:hypothetical protein